jgi:two-component system sensor histidine kinase CpxA
MRGIALKIFGSFWGIFAVLIASSALLRPPGADLRLAHYVHTQGSIASTLLEQRGSDQCGDFAAALAGRGLRLALFDANGRLVCPVPSADSAMLERDIQALRSRTESHLVALATIESPSGTRLTAAGTALPGFFAGILRPSFPYRAVAYAILVSGLVCFAMARYLARPLKLVRDTSYRLASGDLSARAGHAIGHRRDEIGQLVRDFDVMAAQIEAHVHAQHQLLHDISHELRSPLARLNVALELARRNATVDSVTNLDRIEKEAERMNDLIGRLLTLARAENFPHLGRTSVDLGAVIRQVVADARFEAQRHAKSVILAENAAPAIPGHAQLIASAIDNIVRNGLRHTAPQSAVEISVDATQTEAMITVRDHGPGVPASDVEKIFSPFYRVESRRERDGVGLGLPIARRSIEVHRGTVSAANASDGGLCVTIRLPLDSSVEDALLDVSRSMQ